MNIADCYCCAGASLRTAASIHVAKWSPDGEYFATVGKVRRSLPQGEEELAVIVSASEMCDCTECVCPAQDDCLLKVWYPTTGWRSAVVVQDPSDKKSGLVHFSFVYLAHPRSVTGMSWRKTSKYMPK